MVGIIQPLQSSVISFVGVLSNYAKGKTVKRRICNGTPQGSNNLDVVGKRVVQKRRHDMR
jgi:hypothetical protein